MKKLLFILLLCPVFSFAQEEWEKVGTAKNGDEYFIRDVTQKKDSSKIQFWQKMIKSLDYKPTSKTDLLAPGGFVLTRYDADCDERTIHAQMMVYYDKDGNPLKSHICIFKETYVIPDSIGETFLLSACIKLLD